MIRPLTIGLRYKHQDAWVGGVYYVRNLVNALGLLPTDQRPRLVIIGGDQQALDDLRQATGYPDLRRLSRARIERSGDGEEIALILMGSPPGLEDRGVQWVPDFQEHRFPQFFDQAELTSRYQHNTERFARHSHVMVSSQDVASDFRRFYPASQARAHVVRFASFVPVNLPDPRARYGLPERYFLCANQLWKHKNHPLILRALAEAPEAAPVAFTGREEDYRDLSYAPSVRALAAELGVEDRVHFLGFLPRADQLGLMQHAAAVIQPSLCEGWSTVIEDAKALGVPVLASDIAVHREQLPAGADFFDPQDPTALAALLTRYAKADPPPLELDYGAAKLRFAHDLWQMITDIEADFRNRGVARLTIHRPSPLEGEG